MFARFKSNPNDSWLRAVNEPLSSFLLGSFNLARNNGERAVTDFHRVLKFISIMFLTCAFMVPGICILDAFLHIPLADFVVKKLLDLMLMCGSAIVEIGRAD